MAGPLQQAAEAAAKKGESPAKSTMLSPREPRPEAPPDKSATASTAAIIAAARPLYFTLLTVLLVMPMMGFMVAHFALAPRIQQVKKDAKDGKFTDKPQAEPSRETGKGKNGKTEVAPPTFSISDVVVNIHKAPSRFLRANLELEGSPAVILELQRNSGQVRDIASNVLASKQLDELDKPDIRQRLRTEIMTYVNAALKSGEVTSIYLTDFIVQ